MERLAGIYPILATTFSPLGDLDLEAQRRLIDFLMGARVDGLVVAANASEGYALDDAERRLLVQAVIMHVNGRVPVIVTVSHPSTAVAARRAQEAAAEGAAAVMSLPPFYGGWTPDLAGVFEYFAAVNDASSLPVMVQDHPLSGVLMPVEFLARLATELERVRYFKIEVPRAPAKIGALLHHAKDRVLGIFGGLSGVLFLEELERGACGTMPSSSLPEGFVEVYRLVREGDWRGARGVFDRLLPLLNFELNNGGVHVQKEILRLRGVIPSSVIRGPVRVPIDAATREQLGRLLHGLDLLGDGARA